MFDTGADFKILAYNAAKLKVDLSKIRQVILSHNHWDHTDGLWGLLENHPGISVYLCPGSGKLLANKVRKNGGIPVAVKGWRKLQPGVFMTPEMRGLYKGKPMPERALVLSSTKGLVIITGCAHIGAVDILTTVEKRFPKERIAVLLGGLHLKDMDAADIRKTVTTLQDCGVDKMMPCHCTGAKAFKIIDDSYIHKSRFVKAGSSIKIFIKGAL
ncbi:MAG: MBL fold metallo-hydrolase [Fibrobacteres bacterium]|nr:MBL fold metallo-hydrolase [Fibrobacterota bacterium]